MPLCRRSVPCQPCLVFSLAGGSGYDLGPHSSCCSWAHGAFKSSGCSLLSFSCSWALLYFYLFIHLFYTLRCRMYTVRLMQSSTPLTLLTIHLMFCFFFVLVWQDLLLTGFPYVHDTYFQGLSLYMSLRNSE